MSLKWCITICSIIFLLYFRYNDSQIRGITQWWTSVASYIIAYSSSWSNCIGILVDQLLALITPINSIGIYVRYNYARICHFFLLKIKIWNTSAMKLLIDSNSARWFYSVKNFFFHSKTFRWKLVEHSLWPLRPIVLKRA